MNDAQKNGGEEPKDPSGSRHESHNERQTKGPKECNDGQKWKVSEERLLEHLGGWERFKGLHVDCCKCRFAMGEYLNALGEEFVQRRHDVFMGGRE